MPQTVQISHEHIMQTRGECLLLQHVPLDETVEAAADVGLQTLGAWVGWLCTSTGRCPCVRGCSASATLCSLRLHYGQRLPGRGRLQAVMLPAYDWPIAYPLPPKDVQRRAEFDTVLYILPRSAVWLNDAKLPSRSASRWQNARRSWPDSVYRTS